ncbi:amidase [Pseudomonas saliphila]|uniref:amidase n=1 Tax=Pseudomonas saliphila TaxID=2586906 RepID=UPI00123C16A5|nr:amidase family protein [Pseudomonas saliphila]
MDALSRRTFIAGSAAIAGGLALAARPSALFASSKLSFEEYRRHDGLSLGQLVRDGEVSASELLEMAIARTEQINPEINAVVLKHYDQAREAVSQGVPSGPFGGVPFLLKDLGVSMQGTVTTQGSRLFRDAVADADDAYVKKMRKAGLVIFGKSNSPEFGSNPSTESILHGATHNPWALDRSAGGSSGGAAAAVAAGIIPVAHASDGGGSIRIPASCCGLFGLKPSTGLVLKDAAGEDLRGILSAQHVISRSVRDSAAMLDLTARTGLGKAYAVQADQGSYFEQLQRKPGRLRIALMRDPLLPIPVDPACYAAVDMAARQCAALGHEVVEARPPIDMQAAMGAGGTISVVGVAERVAAREAQLGRAATADDLEQVDIGMVGWGRKVSALDYRKALEDLARLREQMRTFMADYDLILSPTIAREPPPLGELDMSLPLDEFGPIATRSSVFTTLYNFTGQPAMSVPLFWSEAGLPIGVMFAGRFAEERTLLRLAGQLEQAHPWFQRVPALS